MSKLNPNGVVIGDECVISGYDRHSEGQKFVVDRIEGTVAFWNGFRAEGANYSAMYLKNLRPVSRPEEFIYDV